MNLKARIAFERRIVRMVVRQAINAGYYVSLYDGGAWTVIQSRSVAAVMRAAMTTDSDILRLTGVSGNQFGRIWFVYGNDGYDVICDHTDSEGMTALLAPIVDYCAAKELAA